MEHQVKTALQHQAPDWHLQNCCPACTYYLEDEKKLTFELLFAMDGNDSLKRVRGRRPTLPDNEPALQPSNKRINTRTCGEEYFISREVVDTLHDSSTDMHSADDEVQAQTG